MAVLASQGHGTVLHAHDAGKATTTRAALPGGEAVVEANFVTRTRMRAVAYGTDALGRLKAVMHIAGVGARATNRLTGCRCAINVLAHNLLTALIERPVRVIYASQHVPRRGTGAA